MCALYSVLYISPRRNAGGSLIRALLSPEHGGIVALLDRLTRHQKERTEPEASEPRSEGRYDVLVRASQGVA
jgi:hypothetical protein